MTEPAWIGIDLGTSAMKSGVWDRRGTCLATSRLCLPGIEVAPGADDTTQQPADWQRLLVDSLGRLRSALDGCRPQAIAVVAHAPSPVLVDARGRALATAPTWCDPVAQRQRVELGAALERPARTGPERLAVAAAARALAVRTALPDAFARARHVLQAADFLASWLIGQPVATSPDWTPALAAAGVERIVEPRLAQPGQSVGPLAPERASALGLPVGLPVVAGGLDSFAGTVGSGIVEVGEACVNLGSSTVISRLAPPGTPGRFQWLGASLVSEPLRRQMDGYQPVPATTVERHTVHQERLLLARMAGDCYPPRRLRAVGGGALDGESMQLRANVFGTPIEIVERPAYAGALGAAILAACATDADASPAAIAGSMSRLAHTVHPQPGISAREERVTRGDREIS